MRMFNLIVGILIFALGFVVANIIETEESSGSRVLEVEEYGR